MQFIQKQSDKIKQAIRDKAIERTKVRILLCDRALEDFSEEELEIIVAEEEQKIYASIKEKSFLAVLAALGIGFFG